MLTQCPECRKVFEAKALKQVKVKAKQKKRSQRQQGFAGAIRNFDNVLGEINR